MLPRPTSLDARAAEIELGGMLEAGQAVTPRQTKDLPQGELPQIGKDGRCLLPVVANPSQRIDSQTLMFAEKPLQQTGKGPCRRGPRNQPVRGRRR